MSAKARTPVARPAKKAAAARSRSRESHATPRAGGHVSVVGIGASAGGLEALKALFGAMPTATGLAFVVVVHLDPTHDSLMPELLAKVTGLRVGQARDREPLEADHVYVIPPNRLLTVDQGLIRVREVADRRGLRGSIDHCFRSLAGDQHERAVAIVLSGTGTEGTLGLRAVKAEGGLVMVQAPDTASQPGMPDSAISTGLVDFVLPPDKMAATLLDYANNTRIHRASTPPAPVPPPLVGLHQILAVLRAQTKFDFRGYRQGTLQRRVERRMELSRIASVGKYIDFLRTQPAEVDQLFKDLLIGVTSFFRDPAAFDEMTTKALAALVREKTASDTPLRIWVPGCSTGEEAYSIAIAAAEQVAAAQSLCRVQVFATDVDDDALEIARGGVYPESIALDVSPQRLARFFTRDNHRYTIAKSIRESVLFAVQNVVSDPPFSKLDLVSCRNVLIYLEPAVQEKVLSVFHFSLNPGGYLFLGAAENTAALDAWFAPASKRSRVFRRLGGGKRPSLPQLRTAAGDTGRAPAKAASGFAAAAALADHALLEHCAPAAVVVRPAGQIVHLYGAMDRYLSLPTGEATLDVLTLARDNLKPPLRAALHEAVRRKRLSVFETHVVKRDRSRTTLRLTVQPLYGQGATERLWLIIFEERPSAAAGRSAQPAADRSEIVRRLETELKATKREQQHLIEQAESSNEELTAANEEVLSMNEELQSTNEELVTSKEELQSMNEELSTLNAQLQDKVQEVITSNDDLANLLVSTDIATVFVDRSLRIKRFTTAATGILHVLPSDVGRPIADVATDILNVDLSREAGSVMESLTPVEQDVNTRDGGHYLLRVLPYRSDGHVVQGAVLTLSDVTALTNTKQELTATLRGMSRLHDVSTRLAGHDGLPALMEEVIHAAIDITSADMGVIQIRNEAGGLTSVAHHGVPPHLLDALNRSRPEFLAAAGMTAFQATPLTAVSGEIVGALSTYARTPDSFTTTDRQWLDLLARQAADLIERRRIDDMRTRATAELDRRVKDRTKWLTLLHDVSQAIDQSANWSDALHLVMRQICEAEGWQAGYVYLPATDASDQLITFVSYSADERFAPFHAMSQQMRYARGQGLPGRVYAEGRHIWANDEATVAQLLPGRQAVAAKAGLKSIAALPVRVGNDILAVVELCSDRPHPESEELLRLIGDVNAQVGRVIEREGTMAQVGEIVWGEQQDLVHTLHDALGQQLTGLGMLAASLHQRLKTTDPDVAATAQQIAGASQQALGQVRELSRGLFPADVDGEGFLDALRRLASTTESLHKIPCAVECDTPFTLPSARVATQLYRIAQEAVTNALRHADAAHITIRLRAEGSATALSVVDDGAGIHRRMPNETGIGLRIMRHRAVSIGASFAAGPGAGGGTVVRCVF